MKVSIQRFKGGVILIQTIIFLLLSITMIIFSIILIFQSIVNLVNKNPSLKQRLQLKKTALVLVAITAINIGLVAYSQVSASTPKIIDENSDIPENSISELLEIELNGRKQWISLRGWDTEKPVLLFLAGGPGGSQLAAVRHELKELEKHFVVVGWDQPGSAKSYDADIIENLCVDTYIQDGHSLTKFLLERFDEEKIYLVGESWGSALGIFLIDSYPEMYHAFVGTGQMVDFAETERIDYNQIGRAHV